jgi:hypothetical protein
MKRRPQGILRVAYDQCESVRVAMRALTFLVEWGRSSDTFGRAMTIEEYAEHVGISRSQAFRRQSAFAACFPTANLERCWEHVRAALDDEWPKSHLDSAWQQACSVGSLSFDRSWFV